MAAALSRALTAVTTAAALASVLPVSTARRALPTYVLSALRIGRLRACFRSETRMRLIADLILANASLPPANLLSQLLCGIIAAPCAWPAPGPIAIIADRGPKIK